MCGVGAAICFTKTLRHHSLFLMKLLTSDLLVELYFLSTFTQQRLWSRTRIRGLFLCRIQTLELKLALCFELEPVVPLEVIQAQQYENMFSASSLFSVVWTSYHVYCKQSQHAAV